MKKLDSNTVYWIILAALGIFLIIGHNVALDIVCKVIAVGLVLAAVSGVYTWWKSKSKEIEALARLIGSLAFLGLGLWILMRTQDFVSFINVVLGFVMIVSRALTLYRSFREGKHIPTIILAVVGMILGLIIACSNAATNAMVVLKGLGLIYTAVVGFLGEVKRATWNG